MKPRIVVLCVSLLAFPAMAQQSTSFKVTDAVFNAGGHPSDGTVLASSSFRVSLDSIGEAVVGTGMSGASFVMDASFAVCYPPAGEVIGLTFTDPTTLIWNPERSTGAYNLYRDSLSNVSGGGYGNCRQQDLMAETATDSDPVPAGDGFFYLVTAENRLGEEGTKGMGDGAPRGGNVCP